MAFETLKKEWSNFLGMLRLARIVGYWNFFRFTLAVIWYRPEIGFAEVKGKPLPIVGHVETAEFIKLIEDDLFNFETREDDVFVVAYGKSGHHWSYDFVNMLLRGNLELDNSTKLAYFLEYLLPAAWGTEPLDRLPVTSPRVIFTHFHADALPREIFEKKRKIVRLIRNPKDVAVSALHHFNAVSFNKRFEWNDFVEQLMDSIEGKTTSTDMFLKNGTDWFDYELDCEAKLNNLDHAIVLYYEDLKENMLPQLRKLSSFLGKEYDDKFLEEVARRTNLDYVKKNKDLGMHDAFVRNGSLYRKGIIGDWKNYFTPDQSRRFDAIIEQKMNNCPIMKNIRYEPM